MKLCYHWCHIGTTRTNAKIYPVTYAKTHDSDLTLCETVVKYMVQKAPDKQTWCEENL